MEPPASTNILGAAAEPPTPIVPSARPTVRPASASSLDTPCPPWNGKGPDSCKGEPLPVSASSFSRMPHSTSSATSLSSPSSSSSSMSMSSLCSCACSFRYLSPLVLLRLPQPLALGAICRPHGRIPRQRCRVIREDEVPRLISPLSKLVSRGREIY